MKTEIKKLPKSEVELTISLERSEFESYLKKAAAELSSVSPVKGFRPGSAPIEMVEQKVGQARLRAEAASLAAKESYVKAILEHGLEPVNEPKIEIKPPSASGGLELTAIAPVLPEVRLPDWRAIKLKKDEVVVSEQEVDSALKTLQRSRASYVTVTRPATKGDRVEIDFTSSVGGAPIDRGESHQHPLILGEGHFMKGFEDEIVGLKEGEKKSFSLEAPHDYYHADLAGKKVDFKVTVRLVQSVSLPEIDDNFAKGTGKFAGLAELKKSISEGLAEEKGERLREKTRLKMIEKIIGETPVFETPDVTIEREIEKMEGELASSLARMGLDRDSYLAHIKKSPAELREYFRPQAEKRVKAALVLAHIAKEEGVEVSDEEVEARVGELLKLTPPEEAARLGPEALERHVRGVLRNEKVFEILEREMVE